MSAARDIKGPWLNTEVLNRVPRVHREFDLNRDPYTAHQLLDLDKTEKQRRDESEGTGVPRGSKMVKRDKPVPTQKPRSETGKSVDRAAFGDRWLVERRDAVLAQAAARDATRDAAREHAPEQGNTQPTGITRGPSL